MKGFSVNSSLIAAMIGGFFATVGVVYQAWRASRTQEQNIKVEGGVALLTGYDKFVEGLQKEIERVRRSCQEEIDILKREHEKDKAAWDIEKDEMRAQIEELQKQVYTLMMQEKRASNKRTRKDDLK